MASTAKSLIQTLRRYMKKPWEITGSCVHTEYKDAVPKATEYRFFCPATVPVKAIIPTSDPEASRHQVFLSRSILNRLRFDGSLEEIDIEKMMKERTFDVNNFPGLI
ncbi:hypothetical protein LOK49_LG01G02436 [Camellia lanceoleosa]|uniref:Uncharacterized protein n=1 Tax=Camellia lanceoleosa TaxID=1840588 RepID=A0ACC0IT05_9ERIC|nr:hypothetical protein LOK49_LG01G02436 [Camellia lanceoleosa]